MTYSNFLSYFCFCCCCCAGVRSITLLCCHVAAVLWLSLQVLLLFLFLSHINNVCDDGDNIVWLCQAINAMIACSLCTQNFTRSHGKWLTVWMEPKPCDKEHLSVINYVSGNLNLVVIVWWLMGDAKLWATSNLYGYKLESIKRLKSCAHVGWIIAK